MTDLEQQLYHTALTARQNAYAPYSKFSVGAAILTDKGQIFAGCNVENASYPCGTCAEAGAISAMITGGERRIKAILILADTACILPCGNCLQKIAEFGSAQTVIYSANLNGIQKTQNLADLLPQNFSVEDMNHA
jgi:cytidine deaminase